MKIEDFISNQLHMEGFPLVGFLNREDALFEDTMSVWLDAGFNGEMKWMEANKNFKSDPCSIESYGISVICVAIPYNTISVKDNPPQKLINRYAWGEDYHKIVKKRLQKTIQIIQREFPQFKGRAFVDSAPLPEKQLAARAGLGWIGKNSLLINKVYGSYLFLGEIISNQTFEYKLSDPRSYCGTCERCVNSCPGHALDSPLGLDCSLCSSYLSIEKRTPFSPVEEDLILDSIFGCDLCQRVCPWNQNAKLSTEKCFTCFDRWKNVELKDILELSEKSFEVLKIKSAVKRAGLEGLKRNAEAYSKNHKSKFFND